MYLFFHAGRMKEDATLRENKVVPGSKLMVIGSTMNAVLSVNQVAPKAAKETPAPEASGKEPLCKQKVELFELVHELNFIYT